MSSLPKDAFQPLQLHAANVHGITRPSQSYWQDAWQRFRSDLRAVTALAVVVMLVLFALAGPLIWPVDPASQDLSQISRGPSLGRTVPVVEPYLAQTPLKAPAVASQQIPDGNATSEFKLRTAATTEVVKLQWSAIPGATGYALFRNIVQPLDRATLGLPIALIPSGNQISYDDRLDLQPQRYYYALVPIFPATETASSAPAQVKERDGWLSLQVQPTQVITDTQAVSLGLITANSATPEFVKLAAHPLGTDYLGRDMLARLIHGARVSLFIGVLAPFAYVILGTLYGGLAGYFGGRVDQVLMRFADFVVALPFLLFMILFRIAFGIGPGESGVGPMIIAMVVLGWPGTARLVRGQILQIREEGYVQAAQLMGGSTMYILLRHMVPNTLGVILVTLTFAVPGAIFTEAFLSFIGMGVAPPTPSWGSMCNEGLKTMLTHPHEILFPALLISITVLAFNLLGDGLRDALDARMRSR